MTYEYLKSMMIPEATISTEALSDKTLGRIGMAVAGAALIFPFIGAALSASKMKKAEAKRKDASKPSSSSSAKNWEDVTPHTSALQSAYPSEVAQEFQARKKFLEKLPGIIRQISRKHAKFIGVEFEVEAQQIEYCLKHDYAIDDYGGLLGFMTEVLPRIHAADGSQYYAEWAWKSDYTIPIFSYDIWTWVQAHPECTNARDFDQTKAYWDEHNAIIAEFATALKGFEFFFSIECGGDWDDGTMDIVFKPSDKIIALANKTSKYRLWPKAPKK
ncbi:MAG: hypothetical protein NC548_05705 [Lachnospiraceae bacterium]|nr:hypothetical protein [Lachnospiraceae bacterium]